jgi:DHA1 family bicyclomycin/chloramphenicol resistance-like MFS transporter
MVLVILALTAALSPVSIDMLAPSLPLLARDIGATPQKIELTIYGFLIGYGLAPSVWGYASDRLGRRPVMLAGMSIYCATSLAGSWASTAEWLIALRFIQGIGAAAGATMARTIVRDIYGAEGTTRGMAAMFSLMALVPFTMPVIGGLIAGYFSWGACFVAMALLGTISAGAYYRLIPETLPTSRGRPAAARNSIVGVVTNRVFAQHALCNMFCIATMVLFGANFSFLLEQNYLFDSRQNGLALALFNGSIALGTYLVWPLMPRFGAHYSILIGAMACTLGWLCIALLTARGITNLMFIAPLLTLACLGCGIIMPLCSGGSLAPFSHNTGTASSLYLMIQSVGASGISFLVGLTVAKQLLPITLAIATCAALALISKIVLSGPRAPELQ